MRVAQIIHKGKSLCTCTLPRKAITHFVLAYTTTHAERDPYIQGGPQKVSHCQMMKKIVLNRIKACE